MRHATRSQFASLFQDLTDQATGSLLAAGMVWCFSVSHHCVTALLPEIACDATYFVIGAPVQGDSRSVLAAKVLPCSQMEAHRPGAAESGQENTYMQ